MSSNLVLNLHAPGRFLPHTFDAMPKSIFIAVHVQTLSPVEVKFPPSEVAINIAHFVNLYSLSQDLQEAVWREFFPEVGQTALVEISEEEIPVLKHPDVSPVTRNPSPAIRNPSPAVAPSVWVGDNLTLTRIEPKVVKHEDLDSFVGALADCREAAGDLLPCDDPRSLTIGFVHHPLQEGESVVHEIRIVWIKATTVSEEVSARVGLTPQEIREKLATPEGREFLVTGKPPEPETTPDQDAELEAVMMADALKIELKDGEVDFPEVDLFKIENPVAVVPDLKFNPIRPRPAWMPAGWASLDLAKDWYRVGVRGEKAPPNATGAYARRGDHLFRAFDDGRWDVSKWVVNNWNEETVPGGYQIYKSSTSQSSLLAALEEVFPLYEATPEALVRI